MSCFSCPNLLNGMCSVRLISQLSASLSCTNISCTFNSPNQSRNKILSERLPTKENNLLKKTLSSIKICCRSSSCPDETIYYTDIQRHEVPKKPNKTATINSVAEHHDFTSESSRDFSIENVLDRIEQNIFISDCEICSGSGNLKYNTKYLNETSSSNCEFEIEANDILSSRQIQRYDGHNGNSDSCCNIYRMNGFNGCCYFQSRAEGFVSDCLWPDQTTFSNQRDYLNHSNYNFTFLHLHHHHQGHHYHQGHHHHFTNTERQHNSHDATLANCKQMNHTRLFLNHHATAFGEPEQMSDNHFYNCYNWSSFKYGWNQSYPITNYSINYSVSFCVGHCHREGNIDFHVNKQGRLIKNNNPRFVNFQRHNSLFNSLCEHHGGFYKGYDSLASCPQNSRAAYVNNHFNDGQPCFNFAGCCVKNRFIDQNVINHHRHHHHHHHHRRGFVEYKRKVETQTWFKSFISSTTQTEFPVESKFCLKTKTLKKVKSERKSRRPIFFVQKRSFKKRRILMKNKYKTCNPPTNEWHFNNLATNCSKEEIQNVYKMLKITSKISNGIKDGGYEGVPCDGCSFYHPNFMTNYNPIEMWNHKDKHDIHRNNYYNTHHNNYHNIHHNIDEVLDHYHHFDMHPCQRLVYEGQIRSKGTTNHHHQECNKIFQDSNTQNNNLYHLPSTNYRNKPTDGNRNTINPGSQHQNNPSSHTYNMRATGNFCQPISNFSLKKISHDDSSLKYHENKNVSNLRNWSQEFHPRNKFCQLHNTSENWNEYKESFKYDDYTHQIMAGWEEIYSNKLIYRFIQT